MACHLRLLGERRAVTARLAAEQDAVLREAQETQARQLQLLQEQHQQQVLSVTAELEARHQAQMQELKASLEREQWALSEARAAELQAEHAAAVGALETSHASHLDSLAARHLSEVQALQGRHRRALQLLRAELEEQLREDASPREVLTRVFKKLKLERDEEPPCTGDGPELPGACQVRCFPGLGSPVPAGVSCTSARVSHSPTRGSPGFPGEVREPQGAYGWFVPRLWLSVLGNAACARGHLPRELAGACRAPPTLSPSPLSSLVPWQVCSC